MNWYPNDLVTDADLTAYESAVLTTFNVTDWADKRRRALEDWLAPILAGHGFSIDQLRTRYELDAVWGYTGAAYTNYGDEATDGTADDLNLATIFATPGSDALYLGSVKPFRGVSMRLLDAVSAVASVLTVSYWNDAWTSLAILDGTAKTSGKTCSGGGAVTWSVPGDWIRRAVNGSSFYYWVKVTVSATPTGARASQIGAIRRSVLAAPVTLRTLTLIMREAPTGGPGPWLEKAAWYETEADAALQRALQSCGGEFDTDDSDLVSATEAEQTAEEVGGEFRWERA